MASSFPTKAFEATVGAQEIIAHVEFFRRSGKPTVAYIERGAEREYMLAAACEEIYVPPLGMVLLFGHCVQGVYVRGALDKVGLEPSVKRLGKYKTGNMLLRKDMSEEEREMWTALLDGIHSQFVAYVANVCLFWGALKMFVQLRSMRCAYLRSFETLLYVSDRAIPSGWWSIGSEHGIIRSYCSRACVVIVLPGAGPGQDGGGGAGTGGRGGVRHAQAP